MDSFIIKFTIAYWFVPASYFICQLQLYISSLITFCFQPIHCEYCILICPKSLHFTLSRTKKKVVFSVSPVYHSEWAQIFTTVVLNVKQMLFKHQLLVVTRIFTFTTSPTQVLQVNVTVKSRLIKSQWKVFLSPILFLIMKA